MKFPVLIGVVLTFFSLIGGVQAGTLSGFSEITINSGTPGGTNFNSGKYWTLLWTETGGMESFNAFIEPEDFKQLSGSEPKEAFTVTSEGTNNKCEFKAQQIIGKEDIYDSDVIFKTVPFWTCPDNFDTEMLQWINQYCWQTGVVCKDNYPILSDTLFCYYAGDKLGTIGQLFDETSTFETTFNAQSETGTLHTATLSNADSGSGKTSNLGEDVAIKWQGSLSSGKVCPVHDFQNAVHSNNIPEVWRIIDNGNYQLYYDFVQPYGGEFSQFLKDMADGAYGDPITQGMNYIEGVWDGRAYNAMAALQIPNQIQIKDQSLHNGKIHILLDYFIHYPQFRMIVDADYLELNIGIAEPEIGSININNWKEGQTEPAYVEITNIGDGPGNIYTRITKCDGGFVDGPEQELHFDAGEQKTLTFPMDCASSQPDQYFSGQCFVQARNDYIPGGPPQIVVEKPFSMTCESIQTCDPGKIICDGNMLMQCDSAGQKWNLLEDCSATGKICDNTQAPPVCIDPGQGCQTNADCDDGNPNTLDECIFSIFGNYCSNTQIGGGGIPFDSSWFYYIIPIFGILIGGIIGRNLIMLLVGAIVGIVGTIAYFLVNIFYYVLFGWLMELLKMGGFNIDTNTLFSSIAIAIMLVVFLVILIIRRDYVKN